MSTTVLAFMQENKTPQPELRAPFYAQATGDAAQQPQLHEYRSTDYMREFEEDLQKQRLSASQSQPWYERNTLDKHQYPSLRQPIHQGYYLASCELGCRGRQHAPVDPKQVQEAWMLLMPQQTQVDVSGLNRRQTQRLRLWQLQQAKQQGTAYPMRASNVTQPNGRKHTLLTGYVPVSQVLQRKIDQELQSEDDQQAMAKQLADKFFDRDQPVARGDQVLWSGNSVQNSLLQLVQLMDENLALGIADNELTYTAAAAVESGDAVSISEWKAWLSEVYFYQIPDTAPNRQLNETQRQLKIRRSNLIAHMPPLAGGVGQAFRDAYNALRQSVQAAVPNVIPNKLRFNQREDFTLQRIQTYTRPWLDYLRTLSQQIDRLQRERQNLLVLPPFLQTLPDSLQQFTQRVDDCRTAAIALEQQFQPQHVMRRQSLLQWYLDRWAQGSDIEIDSDSEEDNAIARQQLEAQLPEGQKLIVAASWMPKGARLIERRWRMLIESITKQWQSAPQAAALVDDDEQLYQLQVVALMKDRRDCEQILFSQLSAPFYIASIYETRLMPSYPIKMPSLKDLKKALSGPGLILPQDLANEVNKLKFPDGEVKQSGAGTGMRWIFVFSIPIVTICAMILLMLMINILNFIFRWIPFAILRIPFPK